VYEDCPLRYAYQYAIGVRGDGTVASELGTLVHDVLAKFLDPAATHTRDATTLRALAEQLWTDDIARFRPQVEEARRAYFQMLDGWWEAEGASPPEVLAVEHEFEIAVGPHVVKGQIDRIDRVPGGIRIVDYKTGKREPAAKEMPDNLQLAVYHLAATRDPAIAAWGEVVQLDLVFVRSMNVRSQDITPDHAARTEERVLALADRILAEDFAPSPQASCRYCDFHRLCPLQPEGREVGAA
jgi:DNA helicase-2/ATP-dependent DNA helicase PcrA